MGERGEVERGEVEVEWSGVEWSGVEWSTYRRDKVKLYIIRQT